MMVLENLGQIVVIVLGFLAVIGGFLLATLAEKDLKKKHKS